MNEDFPFLLFITFKRKIKDVVFTISFINTFYDGIKIKKQDPIFNSTYHGATSN